VSQSALSEGVRRRRAPRWLAAREQDVLDVSYVHVVFTLPHALLRLAIGMPHGLHVGSSS